MSAPLRILCIGGGPAGLYFAMLAKKAEGERFPIAESATIHHVGKEDGEFLAVQRGEDAGLQVRERLHEDRTTCHAWPRGNTRHLVAVVTRTHPERVHQG